jgi:hypothetical protein
MPNQIGVGLFLLGGKEKWSWPGGPGLGTGLRLNGKARQQGGLPGCCDFFLL